MKKTVFVFTLFLSFSVLGQKLSQNEKTKRWEYVEVFEIPKTSPKEIYKRILNNYIPKSDVIQSKIENEKIVIRYNFRMGTFKYGILTETFDIKENKLRWKIHNIVYLKAISSLSKQKELDVTGDKKIIKKMNKLLPDAVKGVQDKIVSAGNGSDEKW